MTLGCKEGLEKLKFLQFTTNSTEGEGEMYNFVTS